MEDQKTVLKTFMGLSEEQNEEKLRVNLKKNGDLSLKDALLHSKNSLLYVISSHKGEKKSSSSGEHVTVEMQRNPKDKMEERNNFNLTEQQSAAVNAENVSRKQTSDNNQNSNKMPLKPSDKVYVCCKEGCHGNSQDERASKESVQSTCQCLSKNADCGKSANPSKTKYVVITVTRTRPAFEEEAETRMEEDKEQTNVSSYLLNEDEEGKKGAVEDNVDAEEKRDAFPDFSTQLCNYHHSPKITSPNISITSAALANSPPPGSSFTRATFSPGSPTDKHSQLPALFSSLRVLRKAPVGPERDTGAQIKPSKRPVFIERQGDSKVQGSILDQISQFLSRDKKGDEKEEGKEMDPEEDQDETTKLNENEESLESPEKKELEKEEGGDVLYEPTKPPVSSAEAAFDAFKAFFTPKPLKKDPAAEKVDLEAVRKKIRAEKDVLRGIFERTSNKMPAKKDSSDGKSETSPPAEGEERTPGRLQAVWPPLKEEKVGLKYTEAEHQAALLQLKRECKEELDKLQDHYGRKLSRLKVESEENVARLETKVAELQAELSQAGTYRRGEVRDVSVSTGDYFLHKSFRTVCVQTDRETFVKTTADEERTGRASPQQQRLTPKKLDLTSISLSLAGQSDETVSSSSSPVPPSHTPVPPPGDSLPLSEPATPQRTIETDNLPPPPPPPPTPPPPIPGLGPPPPPPPPPPGGGLIFDKPPRKLVVETSQPMKPLYWTRIQIQDNNNKTLWNILEEPNIRNTSEFEALFAKAPTQTKRKLLSEAYEKKAKPRKIIKLLDGKRSQAVGILMSSLHLEMKDIQQAVLTVDHSVVDLETIEALYENRAQPEELKRIKKHYETSEEEEVKLLDKPEQFLYELSQIPDFAGRAHCIIFQSAFIDGIASIQRKLSTVSSVCKALLESDGVKEVMGLVLALGNHMNGGSRTRGQADGFGLEILPKLKDVKSRDNRISLVDYVVSYYLHNVDKNAGTDRSTFPLPEPQDVFLAAQVRFDDLNRDLRQLGRDLTTCQKDVENVCAVSPEEHLQPFKDKMEAFVLSGAISLYLLFSFQDLVVYFGLKPKAGEKEVTAGHFFTLWFEFCADFKTRWKRENKSISKQRLKEAQMSVKRLTAEKKVETRKINPNSLKERLRQKEASISES
ncbi:Formin Limb deformity protein [Channa argus]|uniref:Formin Limb deformity protein n=1 Tax=Channa argus TaxID=215402 RepID=A0A6G1QK71_CHAAH|nr:Formin Limb deformity protein [Channa argus]